MCSTVRCRQPPSMRTQAHEALCMRCGMLQISALRVEQPPPPPPLFDGLVVFPLEQQIMLLKYLMYVQNNDQAFARKTEKEPAVQFYSFQSTWVVHTRYEQILVRLPATLSDGWDEELPTATLFELVVAQLNEKKRQFRDVKFELSKCTFIYATVV